MSAATARREIDLEDLSGLPATAAIDRLRACELRPAIEPVDVADPADHGHVVDQNPHANATVRRGQLVTLLIGQASRPPDRKPSAKQPDVRDDLDAVPVLRAPSHTGNPERLEGTAGPPGQDGAELVCGSTSVLTPVAGHAPPLAAAHPAMPSVPAAPKEPAMRPTAAGAPLCRPATRPRTRRLVGLAVTAAAGILAATVMLAPGGSSRHLRSTEHAPAQTATPREARPPAAAARRQARLTRVPSVGRDMPRRRRTGPPAAAAATPQTPTTSAVSSWAPARPAAPRRGAAAPAEPQSTTQVLPPSPTGPLPGPPPNQP
jgi:hypothetical protein